MPKIVEMFVCVLNSLRRSAACVR